ncbi:MAG: endolytic transglycosylase MltG [Patulibacter sp.]
MSLFGGGRRQPRERTAAERRQALIDRERRRTGDPNWQPPADHPLFVGGGADGAVASKGSERGRPHAAAPPDAPTAEPPAPPTATPAPTPTTEPQAQPAPAPPTATPAPAPSLRASTPARPVVPVPEATQDDGGWWAASELFERDLEQQQAAAPAGPAGPAGPVLRPRHPAAHDPAAQATAAPLVIEPDPPAPPPAEAFELPDIRTVAVHRRRGARTVVSPPGDTDMTGTLPRPSRRRRLAVAALVVAVLLVGWSQWKLWQPLKGAGTGEVIVSIPEGSSASEVAAKLQEAGVVDSATLFGLRALIAGKRQDLVAGTLRMKRDMSYGAALAQLSGSNVNTSLQTTSVTVQEGLSIGENAKRFKRQNTLKDYRATARAVFKERRSQLRTLYKMPASAQTLEGFLFPATYELPVPVTSRDLIVRQLQSFQQNFSGISMTHATKAGLTRYEVLIIASMVEREARLTRERRLIAAVIYNRLKADMPLGIDATFRYASGDWTNPIRQSELDTDGPYNSRLRTGLPPTPIGNPGLASIEAAADPADVSYLYFVVKPGRCGEHAFSSTIEKFEADTAKYNQAREKLGRSPVTC